MKYIHTFHFVLSLGSCLCSPGPTTMMSEGTKNIVEAMKARGIRKVVGCMSGTAHHEKCWWRKIKVCMSNVLLCFFIAVMNAFYMQRFVAVVFFELHFDLGFSLHAYSISFLFTPFLYPYPFQPSCCGIAPKSHPVWFLSLRTMTGCTQYWNHRGWTMWLSCHLTLMVSRKWTLGAVANSKL